jgi:recombination protein RecT
MARQKANASLTEQMELSKGGTPVKAGQKALSLTSKSTHHWIRKVAKRGLDEDKLIARLMVETRKNETLGKCSMPSLIQCAMEAASLDLSFGGVMGQCFPVPFYDSKIKGYRAQLIVGYKGYITVAYREGIVIRAGVFYENDDYDYDEGSGHIRHKPSLSDRGEMLGAWAQAEFEDGRKKCKVMNVEDLCTIRDSSQGYRRATDKGYGHPWGDYFPAMCQKSAIRNLFKTLPQGSNLEALAVADGVVHDDDGGNYNPDIIDSTAESVG